MTEVNVITDRLAQALMAEYDRVEKLPRRNLRSGHVRPGARAARERRERAAARMRKVYA